MPAPRILGAVGALGTALALSACSGGGTSTPTDSAPSTSASGTATVSSAAAPRVLGDGELARLITSAPAVAGGAGKAGSADDATRARSERGQLAAGLALAQVQPQDCKPALQKLTAADAAQGGLAVGTYGGLPVELHALPDAAAARHALSSLAQAAGRCQSFTGSVLGRELSGSVQGAPVEGTAADEAYGAIVTLTSGGSTTAEARVAGAVGNVVVMVRGPKGTSPQAAKAALDGLVAAVRGAAG